MCDEAIVADDLAVGAEQPRVRGYFICQIFDSAHPSVFSSKRVVVTFRKMLEFGAEIDLKRAKCRYGLKE